MEGVEGVASPVMLLTLTLTVTPGGHHGRAVRHHRQRGRGHRGQETVDWRDLDVGRVHGRGGHNGAQVGG